MQGHPEHREIVVATAAAGYRAGATTVDVTYYDPLVERAHYEHGSKESLGVVSPWAMRRMRELVKPEGARAVITGEADHGYLDGVDPKRIAAETAGVAAQTKFYRRANLDLNARWTGAAWPTEYWASQVYPELAPLAGKRKLAQDFLWFCRLTDDDGSGATGWLNHVKAIARRSAKLTKLGLGGARAARARHEPRREAHAGSTLARRPGGDVRRREDRAEHADRGVVHEPARDRDERHVRMHVPAHVPGQADRGAARRVLERAARAARGGKASDRDFVASYIDSDPSGNGRRLGEVALVDSTSRIGQSGRTYFHTLLDENAAAHIAFGAGFGGTRPNGTRGLNRATIHLDVMIGGPDFEVTGITPKGKRVPVIADGLWQI